MRHVEPAAFLERQAEQALELGCGALDDRLGLAKAIRISERLDGRLELGVREGALWHRRIIGACLPRSG